MAYDVWNDWFAIHHLKHDESYKFLPPTTGRWEKSRIGWIKYNVDAAFFFSEVGVTTI
jgi:hypothetical protein